MPDQAIRPTITILGCGRMGKALLKGWQDKNLFSKIICVDRNGEKAFKDIEAPDHLYTSLPLDKPTDILMIALKPQSISKAIDDIKRYMSPGTILWSIAAGISTTKFESLLSPDQPIFRIMPNTPASVGKGCFAACCNNAASGFKSQVEESFSALGTFIWVKNDQEIDIVTALSGGAPAYFYSFTQILGDAAHKLGLPKEDAATLARESLIGSAALLEQNPDKELQDLIDDVTSPNGTTEKAIKFFHRSNLRTILSRAIEVAFRRGRELDAEN